jgi:hypothetical protein
MRRAFTIAFFAIFAILALVMAAGAPAYADPGNGNGRGQGNPPEHAGGNGNGNGGNASGNVGGNASAQDPPGFNGHIKVHDGDTEAEPIVRNEPHVGCTFHIHGFDFDVAADGTWNIQSWPPTGDRSVVLSGTWTSDSDGNWRTALLSLGSGHYRVNADQTDPAAPGGEKHKMFWVDCPPAGGGGEEEGGQEGDQGGGQGGGQERDVGGGQQGQVGGQEDVDVVAGVEQAPMAGVSPIIETPAQAEAQAEAQAGAQAGVQAGAQVAGQQAAPVTSLPSTSTEPASALPALIAGMGMWLMRRRFSDR